MCNLCTGEYACVDYMFGVWNGVAVYKQRLFLIVFSVRMCGFYQWHLHCKKEFSKVRDK